MVNCNSVFRSFGSNLPSQMHNPKCPAATRGCWCSFRTIPHLPERIYHNLFSGASVHNQRCLVKCNFAILQLCCKFFCVFFLSSSYYVTETGVQFDRAPVKKYAKQGSTLTGGALLHLNILIGSVLSAPRSPFSWLSCFLSL